MIVCRQGHLNQAAAIVCRQGHLNQAAAPAHPMQAILNHLRDGIELSSELQRVAGKRRTHLSLPDCNECAALRQSPGICDVCPGPVQCARSHSATHQSTIHPSDHLRNACLNPHFRGAPLADEAGSAPLHGNQYALGAGGQAMTAGGAAPIYPRRQPGSRGQHAKQRVCLCEDADAQGPQVGWAGRRTPTPSARPACCLTGSSTRAWSRGGANSNASS